MMHAITLTTPLLLQLLSVGPLPAWGCNIMVKVESLANEPFKFQIAIPSIWAETEGVPLP